MIFTFLPNDLDFFNLPTSKLVCQLFLGNFFNSVKFSVIELMVGTGQTDRETGRCELTRNAAS